MDLDTLLRETGDVPVASVRALSSGRAALDTSVATAAARVAAARRSRRRRSTRVGLTALVGAAATAALVIGPTLGLGSERPAASAEAAQVLLSAADAAGEQPGGWPDAAYWHSVSEHQQSDMDEGAVHRREVWIAHTAVGVLIDEGVDDGATIGLGAAAFPAGGRALTWDELYALPTEPVALERELRDGIDGAGRGDDDELFVIVGDLLRESPAPPALRRALWQVAAGIPGITLVGHVTDAAGRPGVAVQRGVQRYVLDPADGRLLEEGWVGDLQDGETWTYRSTYLDQGPAATAPEPPPLRPGCTSYEIC